MSSYRTILVVTDGSDSSFRAVDRAAQLAAATGATLLLATAYSKMPDRERLAAADRLGDLAYKVQGSTPAEDALRAARERAVAAGAKSLQPVQDQFYGDRSGQFEDPFGHRWSVATHVEDVPPNEMEKRMAEAGQQT